VYATLRRPKPVDTFTLWGLIIYVVTNLCWLGRLCSLLEEVMVPERTVESKQASGGSVMLWAMFCQLTLSGHSSGCEIDMCHLPK
ncbi:hypothetical protein MHYP_G00078430, partial [Metynnis hypsauchen]